MNFLEFINLITFVVSAKLRPDYGPFLILTIISNYGYDWLLLLKLQC